MTSSAKKYSLRSGQDILNIPDEFDETLLQDVKHLSTETAFAKRSTNNSTGKSSTKAKSSTKSAKSTLSNSVSEGTRGKNKQTSGIVTRSSTSSNKGSSKGSGKGSSTASSKGSSQVREEWYDETIFDNKSLKHEVKVKKEAPPSDDSIFCLKCNKTFNSIEDLNAHSKNKCYTKYSYKCLDKKCTKTFSQSLICSSTIKQCIWESSSSVNIVTFTLPTSKLIPNMRKLSTRISCQSQSLSSTHVQIVHIKRMIRLNTLLMWIGISHFLDFVVAIVSKDFIRRHTSHTICQSASM